MHPRSLAALACVLAACGIEPPCPPAELAPLERPPAYAVVLSDWGSSAIAMLDAEGGVITEAWIDSGTYASEISPGLSGDVVLPDALLPGHLAFLERWNYELLTLVTLDTRVIRQIDLRGDAPDPEHRVGAAPNAQDAVRIDATHVLVSRANPSFVPGTPELALGNDVVVVDLEAEAIVRRIELGADVDVAAPTEGDPDATVHIFARPSALAMLERGETRRVLVGLQRLDRSHTRSGPAAIAVIDPDALVRTQVLELPGLSGCGPLAAIPGAADRAIALCAGPSFSPEAERRPGAGVVRLALDDAGSVTIELTWRAADHPEVPAPTSGLVALDPARTVYVSDPRADGGGVDRLVLIELEASSHAILLEAGDSFVLGSGAWDPQRGLLLIPDADARAVQRIDVTDSSAALRDSVPLPTCRTLPPRDISPLPGDRIAPATT